jgi:hypothetical protein
MHCLTKHNMAVHPIVTLVTNPEHPTEVEPLKFDLQAKLYSSYGLHVGQEWAIVNCKAHPTIQAKISASSLYWPPYVDSLVT